MEYERFRLTGLPLKQLDAKIKKSFIEMIGEEIVTELESKIPDELVENHQFNTD